MELARGERKDTIKALAKLRDQTEAPHIALQAAKLLMQYADGDPTPANVPPPPPEADEVGGDLGLEPPPLSPDLEAVLSAPSSGGDAGTPGEGNGGAA